MKMPAKKMEIEGFDEEVVARQPEASRIEICRKALRILFPSPVLTDVLLDDYARMAAFLIGGEAEYVLHDLDSIVGPAAAAVAPAGAPVSVSKVLRHLMVPAGFAQMGGVYFVGDAGAAFARVVTGKMLFVDGLSFVHGEFSHSIQWLLVHHACNSNMLTLQTNVAELYRHSLDCMSVYDLTAEQGGGTIEKKIAVWDFCVDCFVPRKAQHCNLLKSLFSNTARSPAWIQFELTRGRARRTILGQLLAERDERRQFNGRTLAQVRADALAEGTGVKPDDLAQHYRQRALARMAHQPRVVLPGATGALVPDPLHAHQTKSKPQAIKAAEKGGLLSAAEVKTLYDKTKKAGQLLKKENDPLERAWLQLYDQ